jgi:hypothetical protein
MREPAVSINHYETNGVHPPKIVTGRLYEDDIHSDRPLMGNFSPIAAGPAPANTAIAKEKTVWTARSR